MSGQQSGLEPGAELAQLTWARAFRSGLVANLLGATVVFLFLTFAFPTILDDPDEVAEFRLQGAIGTPIYLAVVVPLVVAVLRRRFAPIVGWLHSGRPPADAERRSALRQPLDSVVVWAPFWLLAAILFGLIGATHSAAAGLSIGTGIVLGGMASCALGYLLVERSLRPVTARALAAGPPERPVAPGVSTRLTMAWTLGSGVALLAALVLAVAYLAGADFDATEGFVATAALLVVGLAVGLLAILVAARSVADPVTAMRGALTRVEAGDLAARVEVNDGSEVGLLQAGFNRMAVGLEERERIREAFGTYVDREVAEHILREGTALAGEEVEVTMMFIDIRDFTGYAERFSAPEVVATINRLFKRAVPIIHAHQGHVDKFVGDGLLAVFGAPRRQEDHADRALQAALEIEHATQEEFGGELEIGVGLNSGTVVAGNVGGAGRLEFSVIGDAVNVAARVEAATRKTGDVILLAENVKRLLRDGAVALEERPQVPLKGKRESVKLYSPAVAKEA